MRLRRSVVLLTATLAAARDAILDESVDAATLVAIMRSPSPAPFLRDAAADTAWLRERLLENDGTKSALVEVRGAASTLERVGALVRALDGGGERGNCSLSDDPREKLEQVRQRFGCCSDHSELFLALASLAAVESREVLLPEHQIVEVLDPESRRWILIDPQYGVQLVFATGDPASLADLGLRRGTTVLLVPLPGNQELFARERERRTATYRIAAGSGRIGLTLGSNVGEMARRQRRLRWVARPARRALGTLAGYIPTHATTRVTAGWITFR